MAGGIFKSQNKIRPGAYINFKTIEKPSSTVDERGIVTLPLSLGWGEEKKIIEIKNTEVTDGSLIKKLGFSGYEPEMQYIREALKNSYKLLLYRVNIGTKATKVIGELTATAKYSGVVGNDIKIAIKENDVKFDVIIYLRNLEVAKATVTSIDDLVSLENDFVDFTGTGELIETSAIILEGGTNGQIESGVYDEYFNTLIKKKWDALGLPNVTALEDKKKVVSFIRKCREEKGKKVQAVIYDYDLADYEGIISVKQGYKTSDETVDVNGFICFMAGLTAGSRVNKSNTYFVVPGAVEIINEIDDDSIEDELEKGNLILSYRQDEKVIIEKDINTFTSFTTEKNKIFSKNRVVRTLDAIHNLSKDKFEKTYIGNVDNTENGRSIFKADICSSMEELSKMGAIEGFKAEDISISQGNDSESIVVELFAKPIDAIEKLYMSVSLR